MESSSIKRFILILALVVALVAMVYLAGGIDQLKFDPAMRLIQPSDDADSGRELIYTDLSLLQTFFSFVTILSIPIYIYLLWRYPQMRPWHGLLGILMMFLIVAVIIIWPVAQQVSSSSIPEVEEVPGLREREEPKTITEVSNVVPNRMMINIVGLFIAVGSVGLVASGWVIWRRNRQKKPETLIDFLNPARAALEDIRAGNDIHNVILRCYYQFQTIASAKQLTKNEIGITPHEFAIRLEKAGIPGQDVQRLTSLFEAVRYGNKTFSRQEEVEAEHCLTSVINALEARV